MLGRIATALPSVTFSNADQQKQQDTKSNYIFPLKDVSMVKPFLGLDLDFERECEISARMVAMAAASNYGRFSDFVEHCTDWNT